MLYNVILKSKASFLDKMFTYQYDENILPGTRVIVPFGNANVKTIAIVISKNEIIDYDFKPKYITEILDIKPIISKELIDLALFMVENNLSDYSSAISTILPPGSIDDVEEFYVINQNSKFNDEDIKLYDFLKEEKSYEEIYKNFGEKYKKSYINNLVELGYIDSHIDLKKKSSIKYLENVELIDLDYVGKINKNAKKQIEIIRYLEKKGNSEKRKLLNETKSNVQSLNSLIDKKIIKITRNTIYRNVLQDVKKYNSHILTKEQKFVFDTIINSEKNKFLLHGVTGSGKTEVYLQLVKKYLEEGKQAIILVPEISLTPQTIDRFQGRFGNKIAVLHSKLSISERADQWRLIKNRKVNIVIGARSAIFAPFENLGIIIIDEEHENSYRSDKNPKYSALDIAKKRLNYNDCKLVLGTATPSLKTMYDVESGDIQLLKLDKRVNTHGLPTVDIIDMREELKSNNFTMFSNLLKNKIDEAISKKQQSILFLNKRGHTSFVFCRNCGYVYKCDACDVSMTYHKTKNKLICHYCGRTKIKSKNCPSCGSNKIKEFGAGTEMLEEQTKEIFPNARVYRMDADTVYKKEDYDKVYRMMQNKEIDILIGTQMLAKGLDFPLVTVVGVMSADISLNIPNFRANEMTYGLITQVSGRAGRGEISGNVIIQTYQPNHFSIVSASKNDYYNFYKMDMINRKMFNYPPYIKMLNINISSLDRSYAILKGREIILSINKFLRERKIKLIELTGPTPSLVEKINNRYRFDIILKSEDKYVLLDIANKIRERKYDNKIYINYKIEEE